MNKLVSVKKKCYKENDFIILYTNNKEILNKIFNIKSDLKNTLRLLDYSEPIVQNQYENWKVFKIEGENEV